ncbi:4-hydroxy-2-oxoheptanedioate aldolase [Allopusillimonas ginsengisoli]|uniref:4-hydroxy-2-oxoheptanedioate aldolase n=1 Tax=Allopusillimonas ginsengisoli TaxID=453575 RepID=UPI0039C34B71
MKHPINTFKRALQNGEAQIGLWQGLASPYTAELCATVGYDWLLLDCEHVPNTIQTTLAQLQAVAAHQTAPVIRPAWNDPVELKRLLDIGAQNLLVPMVQNAAEARAAVASVHYPPKGIRGVGTALARAARWGGVSDYLARANEEICLLCQVETVDALGALDEILAVDGVDGVFIGPADLAASMGHIQNPGHPDVRAAIKDAILRIRQAGKAPGILQSDITQAKHYLDMGAQFVAVGVDAVLLRRAATDLLSHFKDEINTVDIQSGSAY